MAGENEAHRADLPYDPQRVVEGDIDEVKRSEFVVMSGGSGSYRAVEGLTDQEAIHYGLEEERPLKARLQLTEGREADQLVAGRDAGIPVNHGSGMHITTNIGATRRLDDPTLPRVSMRPSQKKKKKKRS